jgi:hypothetical protein
MKSHAELNAIRIAAIEAKFQNPFFEFRKSRHGEIREKQKLYYFR